jgi:hypothetical protein
MGHSIMRKTLIANAIKARAARKVSQERTRKHLLRQQMCAERAARVQRHYATTSALYILSQVALGAL